MKYLIPILLSAIVLFAHSSASASNVKHAKKPAAAIEVEATDVVIYLFKKELKKLPGAVTSEQASHYKVAAKLIK